MHIGVTKLNFEAEPNQPPILIVKFVFVGNKSDTVHKAAAVNSWFTHGGQLDINYNEEDDAMTITKTKY